MKNKMSISLVLVGIISIAFIIFLGLEHINNKIPNTVYTVYLEGKSIGTVSSKEKFNRYINEKEKSIKKKYNVKKVYIPKGVNIKKTVTYSNKVDSNSSIYKKLVKRKTFTINGYTIKIKSNGNKDPIVINTLNKKIFDDAINSTILAFVGKEDYDKYMDGNQGEIVETGSIIENIDIKEKITYKEDYISTDENIFTDEGELSKYLLYGTIDKQQSYIVQNNDTISSVAEKNHLNVQEFLIANPEFTSENNLLYETQEVNVGLINPIVSIVVEKHAVEDVARKYSVEVKYDSNAYQGDEHIERNGEDGLDRVTKKYQYINGQVADVTNVSTTELTPSVSELLVKGDKSAPEIADLSYWAWPTEIPYTITTFFAYRWGSFHAALDIAGTGFGSNIYAANNGVVTKAEGGCTPGYISCNGRRGNYIVINHNNGGYYTIYMHLSKINVKTGQTVARGQKIASMGNTGEVSPAPSSYSPYSGTHLHFGVYIGNPIGGGRALNPLSLY